MSDNSKDIILRFIYPTDLSTTDARTIKINQVVEGSSNELEFYEFQHPFVREASFSSAALTTFSRMNTATQRWETAGQIEYRFLTPHTVHFGIEPVYVRDLRKKNSSTSNSRRFTLDGSEFKWKLTEDETDLFCVDAHDRTVAKWSQQQLRLWVAESVLGHLDRIVVTCMLNVWWNQTLESW